MMKSKPILMIFLAAALPAAILLSDFQSDTSCAVTPSQQRQSILDSIDFEFAEKLKQLRGVDQQALCEMPISLLTKAINRIESPKPDHPGEARSFRYQQQLSFQSKSTGEINIENWHKSREEVNAKKQQINFTAGISPELWESIGPGNIGGRIRSFAFDPDNSDRIYAGAVAGGVWLTENAGASWAPTDDFMANLSISSLIFDPTDSDVIYAGTGEGTFNIDNVRGLGIFKSTDKGVSWQSLTNTADNFDFYWVNRLTISSDASRVYAATHTGIWYSNDGGTIWTLASSGRTYDVDVNPNDDSKLVAGRRGSAFYSTDSGITWNQANGLSIATSSRVEIAYARSNPDIVYVSADNNSGEIWKSIDGGQNYSLINTGDSFLGGQGWYDNALWVDPVDANHVIVGGIDLWRSTDGGTNLNKISTWWQAPNSAHADHHFVMEHPDYDGINNKRVFFANDGGMYETPDITVAQDSVGWQELNNNLTITQFYGIGVSPDGTVVGGTQDNGTLVYKNDSENWTATFGGDGGFSAADPTDSNYLYGEYVYLQIHRSTNGGSSSSYIFDSRMETDGANFIAPFILDPNNENRLLGGAERLWQTTNAKDASPAWSTIKDASPSNSPISAIAVASGNSDLIYVGHNDGSLYKTSDGTAATPTWQQVASVAMPGRYLMRVAIDPIDNDIVYASFGGYESTNLWKTSDAGTTWVLATGVAPNNIPPAPIRAIAIHPTQTNLLYVGTEVGIFSSDDAGVSWDFENNGPANVSVDELVWGAQDILYAATHGRGVFWADVFDDSPNPISFASQTDVERSTLIESEQQTITGLGVEVDITISDGEYSLGCTGTYTSSAGRANNGDTVCVSHTSSENYWDNVVTELTVGSSTFNFESRTIADTTPDPFSFDPLVDVDLGATQTSNTVTIIGISNQVDISIDQGEYSIGCDANTFTSDNGTILLDQTVCVRHSASAENFVSTTTTLTVGESSQTFQSTTLPDTEPNAFSFTSVDEVPLSMVQTSETITASGFQIDIPISVTNGEYSLDCATDGFTQTAGVISPNQTVCVRHTSSANYLTATSTQLNINGISASYVSTTSPDRVPDDFSFTSVTDVAVSSQQTSNSITVAGLGVEVEISVSGGEYSIGCSTTFSSASAMISNQQTVCVRHTSSSSNNATTTTNLTVGSKSASFTSTTEAAETKSGGGGSLNWMVILCLLSLVITQITSNNNLIRLKGKN